ncbi:MAG: ATP-binding protein [Acidobacteriota bacterium]
MIKNKKKFPILILVSVILPGIIISILGIYHVSGQKISRELNLRDGVASKLNLFRDSVEDNALELISTVFPDMDKDGIDTGDPGSVLKKIKGIVMDHSVIKYPFIISSSNEFIYPLTRKVSRAPEKITDPAATDSRTGSMYRKGNDLEFSKREFVPAIRAYGESLRSDPPKKVLPYIYNALGRNYFKLGKYFQSSLYYREALNKFPSGRGSRGPLFLTILRQTALSERYLGREISSLKLYLNLYENIIRKESTSGSGTFELYKNEALDFISKFKDDPDKLVPDEKMRKEIRELSESGRQFNWKYVDLEPDMASVEQTDISGERASLLKLQELYTPSDEKSRFYKKLITHLKDKGPGVIKEIRIFNIKLPGGALAEVALGPLGSPGDKGNEPVFGFMVSEGILKEHSIAGPGKNPFGFGDLKILTESGGGGLDKSRSSSHPYFLISAPFKRIFMDHSLNLYSKNMDYFSYRASEEIRFNYILITTLVLSLILGILLFYKYFSRETEILRSKSEFVDRVSHTLKTPLTRLKLMAENISSGWINNEAKKTEFIENIIRETGRMNETIENMLNFSNIEEGKKQYNFENLNLQVITGKILNQYRDELRSSGFILDEEIDMDLPPLPVDIEAFKLILSNLIQNSIKYSAGEKYISVKVFREGLYTILEVKDRGIGISEKDQSEIFNKFFRTGDKNVTAREGSGLGLYIVKHAVEAHNGKIRVKSKHGEGTTISILFPNSDKEKGEE